VWVDDEEFAIERVVLRWHEELRDNAAADAAFLELAMRPLPRDRPLWHLMVAAGPGDRTTLWLSVHHAMMDGMLFARLLQQLFSASMDAAPPARSWRPAAAPSRLALVGPALTAKVPRLARRLSLKPSDPSPPPLPTSLTGAVSATRALAATVVSLRDVQAARARTPGATLNDLYLAVMTEALRDYLPVVPETLLALVPLSIRTQDDDGTVGNRVQSMLVPLPTGLDDPRGRLADIVAFTTAAKQNPRVLGRQGWRFDVALSNVPFGGPFALAGRSIIANRGAVPLQGENRLAAVMTTRDDALTVSFTADGEAFPDVVRLAALTQQAWHRLLVGAA
jgi:hypothetical protein